jgi:glyoxylase I family protein
MIKESNMKDVFSGIDHPAIAAVDVESLAQWYCSTIGYRVYLRTETPIYLIQAPDGTLIEIMPADSTPRPQRTVSTPGWSHLALRVSDMDKAIAALDRVGVQWEGDEFVAAGGGRIRNFKDPEGNVVQIVQRAF